jgi:hypothetical protein
MKKRAVEFNDQSQNTGVTYQSAENRIEAPARIESLMIQAQVLGAEPSEGDKSTLKTASCSTESQGHGSAIGRVYRAAGVVNLMRLVGRLTGAILGGLAISVQIGNVLICVFLILLGPGLVITLLNR